MIDFDSNVIDDLNPKPEPELFVRNVVVNHIKLVDTMMLTRQAIQSVLIEGCCDSLPTKPQRMHHPLG